MPNFIHLRACSSFSLGRGISDTEKLIRSAAARNMKTLAITDRYHPTNVNSILRQSRKNNIKVIIGAEVSIRERNELFSLILLAKNRAGYKNLNSLCSLSFRNEGGPFITSAMLERYSTGLIGLSAGIDGEIGRLLIAGEDNLARQRSDWYTKIFDSQFYHEISGLGLKNENILNERILAFADHEKIVATNNVLYADREDLPVFEKISDILNTDRNAGEAWLKSSDEMLKTFPEASFALENTGKVAFLCDNLANDLNASVCFSGKGNDACYNSLKEKALNGLRKYGKDKNPEYLQRLEYELQVMKDCDFTRKLEIIADITHYARQNDIGIGIGRGSACESLVCYALGITMVDPMKWRNLSFERFLNPERVSLPDIDIDVCSERRHEIVDYIKNKYGEDKIAEICVIKSYKTKSALNAAIKFLAEDENEVARLDKLSREILKLCQKKGINLKSLLSSAFPKEYENDNSFRRLLEYASSLENLPNETAIHQSGVLLSDQPLRENLPTITLRNGQLVAQMESSDIENDPAFLKLDLLSSNVTTIIQHAMKNIEKSGKDAVDCNHLVLNDPEAYEFYSAGEGTGIFQMGGEWASETARKIAPANFYELVLWNAITRPVSDGSRLIDSYVARKNGTEKISYYGMDKILKPILQETRGLVIYQEQIMAIAREIAGYTVGQADDLQHAISKKKTDQISFHKDIFTRQAVEKGWDKKSVEKLFSDIALGGYGFNKAHSIAYAYTSYVTAYLKAHYPLEFIMSVLDHAGSSREGKKTKSKCLEWAFRQNLVEYPDIFKSKEKTEIEDEKIKLGLDFAGLNPTALRDLLELRENWRENPPRTLADLVAQSPYFNKQFLNALNNCGALDSFIDGRENRRLVSDNLDAICAEAAEKRKSLRDINKEKTGKYAFLGISKFVDKNGKPVLLADGENIFENIPDSLFSEKRILAKDLKENSDNETYVIGLVSDFRIIEDYGEKTFRGFFRDESGNIEFCGGENELKDIFDRIERINYYNDCYADIEKSSYLAEGRHIVPNRHIEPGNALNGKEPGNVWKIQFSSMDNDIFRIKSMEPVESHQSYTVIRFPKECHIKNAEDELARIQEKFPCRNGMPEMYYIVYEDAPLRGIFLRSCQEARDAMEKWRETYATTQDMTASLHNPGNMP